MTITSTMFAKLRISRFAAACRADLIGGSTRTLTTSDLPTAMIRTSILGIGSYVPDRIVTNEELAYLDQKHVRQTEKQTETNDEWIRVRSGIEQRHYVPNDGKWACSDLAKEAAVRAIADAKLQPKDIDCIILATLSPDIHFPGTAEAERPLRS